jgi:hypothetical protein
VAKAKLTIRRSRLSFPIFRLGTATLWPAAPTNLPTASSFDEPWLPMT